MYFTFRHFRGKTIIPPGLRRTSVTIHGDFLHAREKLQDTKVTAASRSPKSLAVDLPVETNGHPLVVRGATKPQEAPTQLGVMNGRRRFPRLFRERQVMAEILYRPRQPSTAGP